MFWLLCLGRYTLQHNVPVFQPQLQNEHIATTMGMLAIDDSGAFLNFRLPPTSRESRAFIDLGENITHMATLCRQRPHLRYEIVYVMHTTTNPSSRDVGKV